jgi:hypothetical protein
MAFRSLILFVLTCAAAAGCRKDPYVDAYLDMLNSEKRVLEDRIYQLEYDYEKALKELEATRNRGEGKDSNGGKAAASRRTKDAPPPREPKKTLQDIIPETEIPETEATPEFPKIELPPGLNGADGKQTSSEATDPPDSDDGDGFIVLTAANAEVTDEATPPTQDAPADGPPTVEYIHLNPRLTGGQDFDRQPGDDGLSVLIEPRGKDGQFLPRPAKVSIVVLDPAKSGAASRVARWDFEEELAAKVLRDTALDRGLHFRMPWPDQPPAHERLQLFVRYWCEDGRKLEAERQITVRLPSRTASAWSRRTTRSADAVRTPAAIMPSAPPSTTTARPVPATPAEVPAMAERPGRFWKPTR